MKVHITLKNSAEFELKHVIAIGLMKEVIKHQKTKIMYFKDEEFGFLAYPVNTIVDMKVEE